MSETRSDSDSEFNVPNQFDEETSESNSGEIDNFHEESGERDTVISSDLEPELLNNLIQEKINKIKIKYDNKESVSYLIYTFLRWTFRDFRKVYPQILKILVNKNPIENINNELLELKINKIISSSTIDSVLHDIKSALYSYLYFGFVPEYLLNVNDDYHLDYFMWKTPGLNTILDTKFSKLKETYNTLYKKEKSKIISKIIKNHGGTNIIKYLFKINKRREITGDDTIKYSLSKEVHWNEIYNSDIDPANIINNYMYYGFVPAFLSQEELMDKKMYTFYFRWQKEDDPNRMIRPIGLEITNENFSQWKYWSEEQLKAFYFKNVIPVILKQVELDINPELEVYKKLLNFDHDNNKFILYKKYINQYITEGNVVLNPNVITEIKEFKEQKITRKVFLNLIRQTNKYKESTLLMQLFNVKAKQNDIRSNLNLKLHKLANKNKFNRFKWQGLCSSTNLSELELEELQELGLIDNVPGFLTMTKRELCVEFAKRFTKLIKTKNEGLNKCFNDTSIITLEELKDIPPEFFFSYTQKDSNGVSRTYCDDIRALNNHFNENGELRNPYTNVPLKESFVNRIKEWYNYLQKITNNMDDQGEIIEVSLGSQLSSKMTSLVSKFIQNPVYHNNGQFFVDSNEDTYKRFINKLTEHHVLNEQDSRELLGLTQLNLIQRKMMLVDKLIAKIKNDPQQMTINGQQAGAIALDIAEIYNNTFI